MSKSPEEAQPTPEQNRNEAGPQIQKMTLAELKERVSNARDRRQIGFYSVDASGRASGKIFFLYDVGRREFRFPPDQADMLSARADKTRSVTQEFLESVEAKGGHFEESEYPSN